MVGKDIEMRVGLLVSGNIDNFGWPLKVYNEHLK